MDFTTVLIKYAKNKVRNISQHACLFAFPPSVLAEVTKDGGRGPQQVTQQRAPLLPCRLLKNIPTMRQNELWWYVVLCQGHQFHFNQLPLEIFYSGTKMSLATLHQIASRHPCGDPAWHMNGSPCAMPCQACKSILSFHYIQCSKECVGISWVPLARLSARSPVLQRGADIGRVW